MKIGIIREGKVPMDSRVPLTPEQCAMIREKHGVNVVVQSSNIRCFSDQEYVEQGIKVAESVADCDILLGVKEVPINHLVPGKTYFMFSHTIKAQPYNRELLRAILRLKITLIDYEVLTYEDGTRVIAFGKFAGMVGAHNALWTYGQRTGKPNLPRMNSCTDYSSVKEIYQHTEFPSCKVVLTGTGRVAGGAAMVLDDMGFHQIDSQTFLNIETTRPVYTQLGVTDYAREKSGGEFTEEDFYKNPGRFESAFEPFTRVADIMINGIYWDPRAPAFFRGADMQRHDFAIKVIADITCDIAPESSVPSTLRATAIDDPVYGYDPMTGSETAPFQDHVVDMMTIDNLPNELPRDASNAFGRQFIAHVLPEIISDSSRMLDNATIAEHGQLRENFAYLGTFAGITTPE